MRSRPTRGFCALSISLMLLVSTSASGRPARGPARAAAPARSTNTEYVRRIDANRLNMFESNFGSWAWDIATGNAGLVFPKGSGKTAVFAAGLWLGAQMGGETRVTVAEYTMEYAPGPMRDGTYVADSSQFRVYKVRRYSGDARDTAHVDRTPAELAADPQLDPVAHDSWSEYLNGAAPYGAPVRLWRLPNTSTPDPTDSLDVVGPDVQGDLMTWCVYNDADPARHVISGPGGTAPLGIEVQQTTYAFDRPDALGNTIYLRFRIINKAANLLQNAYVSLWSDVDVGGFSDDLAGCDRSRQLAFAYNGLPTDAVYGSAPPAVGFALLRGPRPPGGSPLGMTAFTRYIGGTDPNSFFESYSYMQGLLADGSPIVNPDGQVTRFMNDGDPLTGSGWLDGSPADRRMNLASGPFTMAPGDTQVVEAAIVVSQGTDALGSLERLECDVDVAGGAWASGFASAPTCPGPRSCPLPASVWAQPCAGDTLLSPTQMTAIAQCVSQRETTFTWPAGQELAQFCATLQPPGGGDLRAQAKREFAALVANACAGSLHTRTSKGDSIFLYPRLAISCAGLPQQMIADLLPRARFRLGFRDGVYLDNNPAHGVPLRGLLLRLPGFGGGAGFSRDLYGSSLDPATMPDSFVTVELRFDHASTQKAYRYLRLELADNGSSTPRGRAYLYGGYRDVPFTVWDVKDNRQLEVAFLERAFTDDAGSLLPGLQQPATFDSTWLPSDDPSTGGHEYLTVYRSTYTGTPRLPFAQDGAYGYLADSLPGLYSLGSYRTSASAVIDDGDAFRFEWGQVASPGLDSLFVMLDSQPLSDPAVQQAYQDVISCLQGINSGSSLNAACDQTTPTLISLVSAEADPDRVRLAWQVESGGGATVERMDPGGAWAAIGTPVAHVGWLVFEDRSVVAGRRYGYRLAIAGPSGRVTGGEAWVSVPAAAVLALHGLRPNPAVGAFAVSFSLASRAPASLEVIDVAGRRVIAREVGSLGPGHHVLSLERGPRLAPGIYLLRLTQARQTLTAKGVLMR